jgi:uracil DNA glycosylase
MNYNLFKPYLNDWGDILKDWVESPECDKIYKTLKECDERILPHYKDIYNFLDISPTNLKVLIINTEPYCDLYKNKKIIATGYGLDNSTTPNDTSHPLLVKFQEGIAKEHNVDYKNKPNLDYLRNQGVMISNRSLTVKYRKPRSYIKLWDSFWAVFLNNMNIGIPIILIGDDAKKLEKYIWKVKHPVYYLPSLEIALKNQSDWNTNNTFKKIKEVIWI